LEQDDDLTKIARKTTEKKEKSVKEFIFDGKCLREKIRLDVVKIYELIEGPVHVKLFNTLG